MLTRLSIRFPKTRSRITGGKRCLQRAGAPALAGRPPPRPPEQTRLGGLLQGWVLTGSAGGGRALPSPPHGAPPLVRTPRGGAVLPSVAGRCEATRPPPSTRRGGGEAGPSCMPARAGLPGWGGGRAGRWHGGFGQEGEEAIGRTKSAVAIMPPGPSSLDDSSPP